jgi:1,4-alpha-glucan branching enzyme
MKKILVLWLLLSGITCAADRYHHNGLKWEDTDDDDVTIAFTQQLQPDGRVKAFYICCNERDSKHSFRVDVRGPAVEGGMHTESQTFTLGKNQFTPMMTYFYTGNVSYIVTSLD